MPNSVWVAFRIFIVLSLYICGGFSSVLCQDATEPIRTIDEQQRKIQIVVARFFQKKETSFSREPLFSSGLVKFKRPHRIHWTYLKPEPMEVALDGKTSWFYTPGRSQVEKYFLARGKRRAQYLEPITAAFQKTFSQLDAAYTPAYEGLEAESTYHFRLQPKEEKVRRFLSRIDLWIDKLSGAILRFEMLESNGDQLSLEFENLQINPLLTDADQMAQAGFDQYRRE